MHNNDTHAWRQAAARVKERDNYQCVYCGSTEDLTVDHIVAKANGGTDDEENLVTACRTCNSKKGTKTNMRLNYINTKWFNT